MLCLGKQCGNTKCISFRTHTEFAGPTQNILVSSILFCLHTSAEYTS